MRRAATEKFKSPESLALVISDMRTGEFKWRQVGRASVDAAGGPEMNPWKANPPPQNTGDSLHFCFVLTNAPGSQGKFKSAEPLVLVISDMRTEEFR